MSTAPTQHEIPRGSRALPVGRAGRLFLAAAAGFALAAPSGVCAAGNYRSPGATHKVRVEQSLAATDTPAATRGKAVADYGAFAVREVDDADLAAVLAVTEGAELADDMNRIMLNAGPLDTTAEYAAALARRLSAGGGPRLALVQFAGPIKPEWMETLEKTGVRVVGYVPNNAYMVYGDDRTLAAAGALTADRARTGLQWAGEFASELKIHPLAAARDSGETKAQRLGRTADNDPGDVFSIQLVDDGTANNGTLDLIKSVQAAPALSDDKALGYLNISVRLTPGSVAAIAARPDVVSIHARPIPIKQCERQAMIVSGNLSTVTPGTPSGPGYLAWLASRGFTAAQFATSNITVDVTDSGIDNGTQTPNHPGLYNLGNTASTSRIVYNRLEGTANAGSTLSGCDGHGNLNTHIIAGFASQPAGFPFTDASGYHFGLGICPWAKVGSSVIFDPANYTDPVFEDLAARAYNNGARVSSNSWGANSGGAYNSDSQRYDALVRDAQSTGSVFPVLGNQEYIVVFSAGNAGPGANTIGTPGTGKNLICVAAGENAQAFGGPDQCSTTDAEADNALDMAPFSSRGPCDDGRVKPDITAPGTHVSGGVAQAAGILATTGTANACYDGSGVCGGTGTPPGGNFFPAGQQFYTASSGTSHSCPGVAGGCALLRQWFINRGLGIPSPALTKALLENTARFMSGTGANESLPGNNQGMGLMDLGAATDTAVSRIYRDQIAGDKFTATGQTRTFLYQVANTAKPTRITLAWTDAPGATTGNAYNNDLDLEVALNGTVYKGNVFSGATSIGGGVRDQKNNVESVFLPAGVSGIFSVRIVASNIVSDGVPGDAAALDQDFAMVVNNATLAPDTVLLGGVGAAVVTESCFPANGLTIDPFETVGVNFTIQNLGNIGSGQVLATLRGGQGVVNAPPAAVDFGVIAAGASVTRTIPFTAVGECASTFTTYLDMTNGGVAAGTAQFPMAFGGARGASPVASVSYTGPPVAIPDNNTTGATARVTVSGAPATFKDIVFSFDGSACSAAAGATSVGLDHTFMGDLRITLTGPDGTSAVLWDNRGGTGNNLCNTVFDDLSTTLVSSVTSAGAPFTDRYRPAQPLSAFAGKNPNGIWRLNVVDNASADTGNIRAFTLKFYDKACCANTSAFNSDLATEAGWSAFPAPVAGETFSDASPGILGGRVTASAVTGKVRVAGWKSDNPAWLPYAAVGAANHVRAKFSLYATGQADGTAKNQVPNVRLRVANRFACSSLLEVLHHNNADPAGTLIGQDLIPSRSSANPSLYRVDYDPPEVPAILASPMSEGLLRAFEAYAQDTQDNGSIVCAESSLGIYPATPSATAAPASLVKSYAASSSDFVGAQFGSVKLLFNPDPNGPSVLTDATGPQPSAGLTPGGAISLDTSAVESNRVGVAKVDVPGNLADITVKAGRVRVEEGKQYKIRFHATASIPANRNALVRFKARSAKFGWVQDLEVGGAFGAGATNNAIAQAILPGTGSLNPDQLVPGEAGGWYTLLMHSPLSRQIRADQGGLATPLSTSMPNLSAEPGPGVEASSNRDIKVGADLIDTLSSGTGSDTETGQVAIDRITVQSFPLVAD